MRLQIWWLMAFIVGSLCGRATDFGYKHLQVLSLWLLVSLMVCLAAAFYFDVDYVRRHAVKLTVAAAFIWSFTHNVPLADQPMPRIKVERAMGINGEWSILIVRQGNHFFETQGNGKVHGMGAISCRAQISMFSQKFCFVRNVVNTAENAGDTGFSLVIKRTKGLLISRLNYVESDLRGWFNGIIWGEKSGLDDKLKEAFMQTGTYHLLVVSGLHVTLIAFVLGVLLRVPALLLYSCRILSARTWISTSLALDLLSCLAVFIYAWITGMSAAAQRAFFLYSVWRLTPIFIGYQRSSERLLLAFTAQTLCFPGGFLNQASLMSWSCYLLFWEFCSEDQKSVSKFLIKSVIINVKLAVLTGMFFGNFSIAGVILNLVIVPGFSWLLFSGVFLVLVGDTFQSVAEYVLKTHHQFLNFMETIHEWLLTIPQFIVINRSEVRVLFLILGLYLVLNCLRKMSIREAVEVS
jgi:ComEC/Rec2-related protein